MNLSGSWKANYIGNLSDNPNQLITLTQNGSKLKGTIKIVRWADNSEANEDLKFEGSIKGEKAIITFYDKKRSNLVFGAMIMKIQDNGEILDGSVVSVEPTDNSIHYEKRKWSKIKI